MMGCMKRKVFININIPDKVKKRLVRAMEAFSDLPVKWTKEQNLHVSFLPIGYVLDEAVFDICEKVREACEGLEIADMEFDEIVIGPSEDDPRAIWLNGKPSAEFLVAYEKIEKSLGFISAKKKSFKPHIVLGKIRKHLWDELLIEQKKVQKSFPLIVTMESLDVMASEFEDAGMEFSIIESCPLN
jgi:2'-5' RNA ligase